MTYIHSPFLRVEKIFEKLFLREIFPINGKQKKKTEKKTALATEFIYI